MAVFRRFLRLFCGAFFALAVVFVSQNAFSVSCSTGTAGQYKITNYCYSCPAGCYCTGQDADGLDPSGHSGNISESEVIAWCSNGSSCDWSAGTSSQGGTQCGQSDNAHIYRCPSLYPNSATSTTAQTKCYATRSLAAGKYLSSTGVVLACPRNYYCPSIGTFTAYYGTTYNNNQCPKSGYMHSTRDGQSLAGAVNIDDPNWTGTNTVNTGSSQETQCYRYKDVSKLPGCTEGEVRQFFTNRTIQQQEAGGTAVHTIATSSYGGDLTIGTALKAANDYYVDGTQCSACAANAQQPAYGSTATYCTCRTGYSGGGGTSNPSGSNCQPITSVIVLISNGAVEAGTTSLYTTYNTSVYSDSEKTKSMSANTNPITIPTKTGYVFDGYYDFNNNTQYINSNGYITTAGLNTAKAYSTIGTNNWYAKWTEIAYPFTLTTTEMTENDIFRWMISASGTFYVDCGDDGVLSGTGVSGNKITRSNTTRAQYTCTYPTAGTHIIRIGGAANGYNASIGNNNLYSGSYAAIGFSYRDYSGNTQEKIASISGSLGAIFGTIENGDTLATQPRFEMTFAYASNMKGSIPSDLFTGITGAPAQEMFYETFRDCSGLTGSIPPTLFAGIHGAPAKQMFDGTFQGCSGLTGSIPSTLFCQDTNNPNANNCIYGAPASSMFYRTFYGCNNLSGQIPATLFAGIHGAPAQYMFGNTFNGCSRLNKFTDGTTTTSYVPGTFLSDIEDASGNGYVSNMFTGTGLLASCPTGMYNSTRSQFNDAGKPWCSASAYTITYACGNGATGNPPANGTATYNANFTPAANNTCAKTGYAFAGWNDGSVDRAAGTTFKWTYTSDKTLTAKWTKIEYPFTLTTTNMTANDTFKWSMSAAGTFYVDCGDNGVLSGTGVSGNIIIRSDTIAAQYTCTPNRWNTYNTYGWCGK